MVQSLVVMSDTLVLGRRPPHGCGDGLCEKLRAVGGNAREAGERTGELRTGPPGGVAEEGASRGDPEDEATCWGRRAGNPA